MEEFLQRFNKAKTRAIREWRKIDPCLRETMSFSQFSNHLINAEFGYKFVVMLILLIYF